MALPVVCSKGHAYIQSDIYRNWPEGAPYCPECFAKWKLENSPKQDQPEDQSSRLKNALRELLDATVEFEMGPNYYPEVIRARLHAHEVLKEKSI